MVPTAVFDTYWRFAAERQAIFFRRLAGSAGPLTADPILGRYRFTNAYRASDRVSQYLIREIQYHPDRSQAPRELFYRTLLFKIFNRIETWQAIEAELGPVAWDGVDLNTISAVLERLLAAGSRVYSAAYIMPAPAYGHRRKHANHLALLAQMMEDRLPDRLQQAPSLREVYEWMLAYPGLGPFLAFQFAMDLNYSSLLDFDEADFVVAGPGAVDGIAKCFEHVGRMTAEQVCHETAVRQGKEFARLGLDFQDLFGRPLQPIDCQNLFCEISKYARVAHPEIQGVSGRTRIKQGYRPLARPVAPPAYPPRWSLSPRGHGPWCNGP